MVMSQKTLCFPFARPALCSQKRLAMPGKCIGQGASTTLSHRPFSRELSGISLEKICGRLDTFGVPGSAQSPHGLITVREVHGSHFQTHHEVGKRVGRRSETHRKAASQGPGSFAMESAHSNSGASASATARCSAALVRSNRCLAYLSGVRASARGSAARSFSERWHSRPES